MAGNYFKARGVFILKLTVVGVGLGNPETLTLAALHALEQASLVVGAQRILESLPQSVCGEKRFAVKPQAIAEIVVQNERMPAVCVAMSGDTGFYSGAAKLLPLLEAAGFCPEVLPGLSTVQYMAARLHRPWQGVHLVSAHGVACNVVGHVLCAQESFFLTGGTVTPQSIVAALCEAEVPNVTVDVGENLSYENECVTSGAPQALAGRAFAALSAVWVRRAAQTPAYPFCNSGIPDALFVRGTAEQGKIIPMTKQEVRAAVLAKLGVGREDVVYDIGAGTGTVAVEMALASPLAQIFAVEVNPAGCALVRQNRAKFGAYNITVVEGSAPEALAGLPTPDAVFIGGSKGNLLAILQALKAKNPAVRVAVSAIALETLAEAGSALRALGFAQPSAVQIAVSRTKAVGPYQMLTAQNPVFILSAGHTAL